MESKTTEQTLAYLVPLIQGQVKQSLSPYIVAIGGAGGCGKSHFTKLIHSQIPESSFLQLDHYKTPRTERYPNKIFGAHPEANRMSLIKNSLINLKEGRSIEIPQYCNTLGRATATKTFTASKIIFVDGEISTYDELRELFDFTIFIDSSWKTQLQTRVNRDIEVRGYTPEKAIETFLHSNLYEFKEFGLHTRELVDLVLFSDSSYNITIKN